MINGLTSKYGHLLAATHICNFASSHPSTPKIAKECDYHQEREEKIKNILPLRSKKDKKIVHKLALEKAATVANKVYENIGRTRVATSIVLSKNILLGRQIRFHKALHFIHKPLVLIKT